MNVYGYGRGADYLSSQSAIPDHMKSNELGDLDQRPSFMRGGFFPPWLGVPRALGEWKPKLEPFGLGSIGLPKSSVYNFLKDNPLLVMGAGVGLGIFLAKKFIFGKKKRRRRRRKKRSR